MRKCLVYVGLPLVSLAAYFAVRVIARCIDASRIDYMPDAELLEQLDDCGCEL